MADKTVRITIKAEDSFSSVLNQYNLAMGKAVDSTKNIGTETQKSKGFLSDFNSVLQAGAAIWAVKNSFAIIEDITALGQESLKTKAVFEALVGGSQNVANALVTLNAATGGIVDNMTLMGGTSKMLQMGLADSTDEAAQFIEMAVKLGGVMGHDVKDSIENFTLMLANQSILRLDTYGISGSRVRERMKELMDTTNGLTKEQAFLQATLEQGNIAMENLGDSAEAGVTALAKFQKGIEDAKAAVGEFFAEGVENGAQLLDQITTIFDLIGSENNLSEIRASVQADIDVMDEFNVKMDEAIDRVKAWYSEVYGTSGEEFPMYEDIKRLYEIVEAHEGMSLTDIIDTDPAAFGDLLGAVVNDTAMWQETLDKVGTQFEHINAEADEQSAKVQANTLAAMEQGILYDRISDGMRSATLEGENWVKLGKQFEDVQKQVVAAVDAEVESRKRINELVERGGSALNAYREAQDAIMFGLNLGNLQSSGSGLKLGMGMDDLQEFQSMSADIQGMFGGEMSQFSIGDAALGKLDTYVSMLDEEMARMREMHDQGFISDEQLAASEEAYSNITGMADEAHRLADNINNMNLSQLLGETSGGVLGELNAMTIEAMRASGASDEEIAAAQSTFDLSSGKETDFSQFFEGEIPELLAQIAEEVSPEAAADAQMRVIAAMQEGRAAGLDDAGLEAVVRNAVGYELQDAGIGQQFTVGAGDTVSGLMSQTGMTQEQIMMAAGITNPRLLQPGTYGAEGGGNLLATGSFLNTPNVAPTGAYGAFGMNTPFNPFGGNSDTATQGGEEGEDPLAAMQQNIDGINSSLDMTAEKAIELRTAFVEPKTELDDLKDSLEELAGMDLAVTVKINALMTPELRSLLNGTNANIGDEIRNNGGIVPGADSRSRPSGGTGVF